MAERDFKRAAPPVPQHPLSDRGTLRSIFECVGFGQWLYVAEVNKVWCAVYRLYCELTTRQLESAAKKHKVQRSMSRILIYKSSSTLYTQAFASPSRLQWACNFELALGDVKTLLLQAGKVADKRTLLWARAHGLPWTEALCEGAAAAGRLELLQWLHIEQGCPWDTVRTTLAAIKACHLPMIAWLQSNMLGFRTIVAGVVHAERYKAIDRHSDQSWAASLSTVTLIANDSLYESEFFENLSIVAAWGGYTHTLRWLHARDKLRHPTFCALTRFAANRGHLDALRFLHEDCGIALSFTDDAAHDLVEASSSGSVPVMQYILLRQQQQQSTEPSGAVLGRCVSSAGFNGHVDALTWLLARGARSNAPLCRFILLNRMVKMCWPLVTLRIVLEADLYTWSDAYGLCSELFAAGYTDEVDWLHSSGYARCGEDCPERRKVAPQQRVQGAHDPIWRRVR